MAQRSWSAPNEGYWRETDLCFLPTRQPIIEHWLNNAGNPILRSVRRLQRSIDNFERCAVNWHPISSKCYPNSSSRASKKTKKKMKTKKLQKRDRLRLFFSLRKQRARQPTIHRRFYVFAAL